MIRLDRHAVIDRLGPHLDMRHGLLRLMVNLDVKIHHARGFISFHNDWCSD